MKWAFGVDPNPRNIAIAITFGAALAALVLLFDPTQWWARIAAALLAFDIGAGLISNATKATAAKWRSAPKLARTIYIAGHLSIYPLALFALVANPALFWLLIALLLVKTGLFIANTRPATSR
jgi:hypothetical protein